MSKIEQTVDSSATGSSTVDSRALDPGAIDPRQSFVDALLSRANVLLQMLRRVSKGDDPALQRGVASRARHLLSLESRLVLPELQQAGVLDEEQSAHCREVHARCESILDQVRAGPGDPSWLHNCFQALAAMLLPHLRRMLKYYPSLPRLPAR